MASQVVSPQGLPDFYDPVATPARFDPDVADKGALATALVEVRHPGDAALGQGHAGTGVRLDSAPDVDDTVFMRHGKCGARGILGHQLSPDSWLDQNFLPWRGHCLGARAVRKMSIDEFPAWLS